MPIEQPESGGGVPSLDPVLRIVEHYDGIARQLERDIEILRGFLISAQTGCQYTLDSSVSRIYTEPYLHSDLIPTQLIEGMSVEVIGYIYDDPGAWVKIRFMTTNEVIEGWIIVLRHHLPDCAGELANECSVTATQEIPYYLSTEDYLTGGDPDGNIEKGESLIISIRYSDDDLGLHLVKARREQGSATPFWFNSSGGVVKGDSSNLTCDNLPFYVSTNGLVHVNCKLSDLIPSVKARTHASFYGSAVASFPKGSTFRNYEEQRDSPTEDEDGYTPPSANWVRITEYGGYNGETLWIRREDRYGNVLLSNGSANCGTAGTEGLSQGTPVNDPDIPAVPNDPSDSVANLTETEQLAWVIACEASRAFNTQDDLQQAYTDLAHVIRNRVQASGFPGTPIQVISQGEAFTCYWDGDAPDDINTVPGIDHALFLARSLENNLLLPSPSFVELNAALFFFGLPFRAGEDPNQYANAPANSIPVADVINTFIDKGVVGVDRTTLEGIYIGHSQMNSNAFGTFYFSDDPRFTGVVP